jgi:hypothetical protein
MGKEAGMTNRLDRAETRDDERATGGPKRRGGVAW